jgi:hypothetical protein
MENNFTNIHINDIFLEVNFGLYGVCWSPYFDDNLAVPLSLLILESMVNFQTC